jgi:hypothetical protein
MEQYFYPVILQHTSSESDFDEKAYFRDLLLLLKEKLSVKDTEAKKTVSDIIQKNGASLRGGLAQFLSTPIKSDKDEIDLLIKENFENILKNLGFGPSFNSVKPEIFRVMEPHQVPLHRQLVGVIRRILKNGKISLTDAGVSSGKNSGTIYCFTAVVDGFTSLYSLKDAFENCLDVKPEITFTIVNESVLAVIHSVAVEQTAANHVVIMNFTSTNEGVERIQNKMSVMTTQFGIKEAKLLKRSFSTGFTTPYQLQFAFDINKHALGSIILSVVEDDQEMEDALTTQGSLIVLEKII